MKILVIEDDKYTAEALKIALLEAGYIVEIEIVTESIFSWESLGFSEYDLILLDVGLPKLDNLVFYRRLVDKGCKTPVLLMLDNRHKHEIELNLKGVITEFIIKPFDLQDLILQIDSLLSKDYFLFQPTLTLGSLILNFKSQQITYYHNKVFLNPQETSIIELFFRHQKRIFSRSTLVDLVAYFDSTITKQSIPRIIKDLSDKFEDLGISNSIETVYGNGYHFSYHQLGFIDGMVDFSSQETLLDRKFLPSLWIVSQDIDFISQLSSASSSWGLKAHSIDNVEAAVIEIPNQENNVILLDISIADRAEELRGLLAEVYVRKCLVPLVTVLSKEDIKDRLLIGDFYTQGVCSKCDSITEILYVVNSTIRKFNFSECNILLIDSDPNLLSQIRHLLEPWGFIIVTLEKELKFWETIRVFKPAVLLLGELDSQEDSWKICQSLRKCPDLAAISIIFLVSDLNNLVINQIFDAGGDDFVSKPIIEAELVNRVLNSWEKLKRFSYLPIDRLDRLPKQQESMRELEKLLHLARRQNQHLSLVVLRIENLTEIRKLFDYVSNNHVLQLLRDFLQESLRTEDVVTCWGEELLVSMYGINKIDALERFNKILVRVRTQQFIAHNGNKFGVNCTMKIGQYPEDGTDINLLYQSIKKSKF